MLTIVTPVDHKFVTGRLCGGMGLYHISYWAEVWLVVRSARAVRAPLFHESGTRRIKPPHKQISVLRVRYRDSRAGAFSNKEML